MAEFLNLPNPSTYTIHAMRRSAANVMAEAGASNALMKKHFNWKGDSTSNKYIDNTKSAKITISNMMASSNGGSHLSDRDDTKVINLNNCSNIVINF